MKKARKRILFWGIGLILLCGITSCTTKKNTFFYRAYHGTTTRFNIYFNGNESYKEAVEILDNSIKDNYTTILPVFPRPPKAEALKESPKLDRSIEKCSKAIKKHSMFIKGVEYCKPIPDCYLLMGKAYFQRQDFSDAMSVFSYIVNVHKNSKVWAEGNTWKARTNLALNRIGEAEGNLEEVRQSIEESKNKNYKLHWEATYAELMLTQKNYEQAIISLTEALTYKRQMKKDFRTRIHFILAQTYQKLGQSHNAADNYEIVLKRNPAYEMNFNAVINLSLCGATDKKSKNTAREKLKKMLKDERNETYKDQIFYALAQLDLREEKTDDAIKNLEASVYWSINNVYQKTVSALQLAELYFDNSQFVESQTYYDTVVKIIPTTFPNYEDIKLRASILRNLVENLMLVKQQDELQKMARMDGKERLAHIDSLIADYNKREQERIDDENEKKMLMENDSKKSSNKQAGNSAGKWLFYNPTQVKLGMQEFRKRWGNRDLADYWFVKDIQVTDLFVDNTTADSTNNANAADSNTRTNAKSGVKSSDPRDRNYYLQNVPFTNEQMQASNELIASGLFNSGMIYSDDLHDYEKAIKQWEDFLTRFPDHKLVAPIYFQLYETYSYLKDIEKSDYYKNLILEHYPNTNYARIIQNPDYYKEVAAKQKESADFYVSVYETYTKKDYAATINLANTGLEKYPFPTLAPKFDYLKAISISKLYGNDTLLALLPEIIRNYPATEIDTAATGLLEALKKLKQKDTQISVADSSAKTQNTKPVYVYDSKAFHFVIILANSKEVKVDQLKGHLSNFNTEFFRLQKFDPISSFYLDDNVTQMVTISKFENKDKAMDYYNILKTDTKYVGYLKTTPSTKIYVISDANYVTFYKQNKDKRDQYDTFFKENYLK